MLQWGVLCHLLGSVGRGVLSRKHILVMALYSSHTALPASGPKTHLGPCVNSSVGQGFGTRHLSRGASQVLLVVKNPPANDGDLRDAGREDPLEEAMATHSGILAWRLPWAEEPGGPQSMGGTIGQLKSLFYVNVKV